MPNFVKISRWKRFPIIQIFFDNVESKLKQKSPKTVLYLFRFPGSLLLFKGWIQISKDNFHACNPSWKSKHQLILKDFYPRLFFFRLQ